MPLSRERMRERKRHDRVKPMSNLNGLGAVKPKLESVGLKLEGNRIVRLEKLDVKPSIPVYNPAIHGAGDTVLVQRGKRMVPTTIPSLDADGNPMPW